MADTRKDKRSAVALKVRFKSATVDEFIEQYSTDLSRGGIFVKSGRPMKVGTLLKFQFQLKDESSLIRGVGRVVWTREDDSDPEAPPGMGIKFIKMDDASKQVLDRVLSQGEQAHESRFEVGPGPGKGETEPAGAHPSDPPEGSFFPSTSSESDLPPPEDRTAVRHASEFLAGALSGVEDPDAAREAEETAEQARKRSEEIDAERAAEAKKSAEPSIMVDPSLESERPPPAAPDGGDADEDDEDDAETTLHEKHTDPERDIDTEVGTTEQLERLAAERAARKREQQEEADAALEASKTVETSSPSKPAPAAAAAPPEKAQGGGRGLVVAFVIAAALVFLYLAFSGDEQTPTSAATGEPEPVAVEPEATEPAVAPVEEQDAGVEDETDEEQPADEDEDVAEDEQAEAQAQASETPDEPEEEGSEASADAKTVNLRVRTVPDGAELFVDDEARGTAPARLELTAGEPVTLRAKLPGREEVVREITPEVEGGHFMRIVLPRLPYVLSVVSEPVGATAIAGGKRADTPAEINLGIPRGGRIRVLVRKPGFVQARRYVLVGQFEESDGAMRQTLEVELTEKPARAKPRRAPSPSPGGAQPSAPAEQPESGDGAESEAAESEAEATPGESDTEPAPSESETDATPSDSETGSAPNSGPEAKQPAEPAEEPDEPGEAEQPAPASP